MKKNIFGSWIVAGVVIGAIIGTLRHDLLKWVVIGVIAGVIVGAVLHNFQKPRK